MGAQCVRDATAARIANITYCTTSSLHTSPTMNGLQYLVKLVTSQLHRFGRRMHGDDDGSPKPRAWRSITGTWLATVGYTVHGPHLSNSSMPGAKCREQDCAAATTRAPLRSIFTRPSMLRPRIINVSTYLDAPRVPSEKGAVSYRDNINLTHLTSSRTCAQRTA